MSILPSLVLLKMMITGRDSHEPEKIRQTPIDELRGGRTDRITHAPAFLDTVDFLFS